MKDERVRELRELAKKWRDYQPTDYEREAHPTGYIRQTFEECASELEAALEAEATVAVTSNTFALNSDGTSPYITPSTIHVARQQEREGEAEAPVAGPQWNVEQILVYIWQLCAGDQTEQEYPYANFRDSEGGKMLRQQLNGLQAGQERENERSRQEKLDPRNGI
jgi:hypothetical protein